MKLAQLVLDGVFPPICIGCSADGEWMCPGCVAAIPLVGEVPVSMDVPLDRLLVVSVYRDPLIGGLIRSLKYQRALCLEDEVLGRLLRRFAQEVDFLSLLGHAPTIIVPLAMDSERERVRGLDHAFHIAQLVQSILFPDVPLVQALTRTKSTKTNARLTTVEARQANIQGVFACKVSVQGQSILLVDDVYTTGASLGEASRVLREAGAEHVQALTLAKS